MSAIERLYRLADDLISHKLWNTIRCGSEHEYGVTNESDKTLEDLLREIADQARRERDSLLSADAVEALEWVREHGGLENVRDAWDEAVNLCATIGCEPNNESEMLQALGDCTDIVIKRLMPKGYEWPRYEDGEPVELGDEVSARTGGTFAIGSVTLRDDSFALNASWYDKGERVKRPAVLAADGEPMEVGQTVWHVSNGIEFTVVGLPKSGEYQAVKLRLDDGAFTGLDPDQLTHQRPVLDAEGNRIEPAMDVWWVCEGDERGVHAEKLHVESISEDGLVTCDPFNGGTWVELEPSELYVNKPVLDADGVPIREGDTVWFVGGGEPAEVAYTITADASHPDEVVLKGYEDDWPVNADKLTHTKPEPPDSWERIEEDKDLNPFDYCKKVGHKLWTFDNAEEFKASDLVRRCRALAERERGE